jgi:DNA-binding MarR family transcriptional regulator
VTGFDHDADAAWISDWETLHHAVSSAHAQVIARVEAIGVSSQFFAVLHLLLPLPDHRMSMSGLARELAMTSGGFTKLCDRMGREGLIDRRGSDGDRRVVFATLTTTGIEVAERAEASYVAAVRELVVAAATPATLGRLAVDARTLDVLRYATETPVLTASWDPALPDRREGASVSALDDARQHRDMY